MARRRGETHARWGWWVWWGFLLGVMSLWTLSGCSSLQAVVMTEADVAQAQAIIEAKDIRLCVKIDGSGTLPGVPVQGSIEGFMMGGKGMTTEDCIKALGVRP